MRRVIIFLSIAMFCSALQATSFILSLPQKVRGCKAVLRVTITAVHPPASPSPTDPFASPLGLAVCRAKVKEVLKGSKGMTDVRFSFVPDSPSPDAGLEKLVGGTFIVFLHEVDGGYFVLEGPAGIRPISRTYHEVRFEDEKFVKESYGYNEFVATIRQLASL